MHETSKSKFKRFPHMPTERSTMKIPRIATEEVLALIADMVCVNEVELMEPGRKYWVREYHNVASGESVYIGGDFTQLEEAQR